MSSGRVRDDGVDMKPQAVHRAASAWWAPMVCGPQRTRSMADDNRYTAGPERRRGVGAIGKRDAITCHTAGAVGEGREKSDWRREEPCSQGVDIHTFGIRNDGRHAHSPRLCASPERLISDERRSADACTIASRPLVFG